MRLLYLNEEGDFCFTEDHHDAPEPYAVLSHTWLSKDEELTYQDIKQKSGQQKPGYAKLQFLAKQAADDEYKYFWIDTCCIDKQIDAEIKEAIRAMFRWYQNSAVCYVYLEDVSDKKRQRDGTETWQDTFRDCRWFKRGWTLQELIGPRNVKFFARGDLLGTKDSLSQLIEEATGISKEIFLPGGISHEDVRIQLRLQWINGRETTKPEDLIYCQMGICGVTLNPRYGEGKDEAQRRFNRKIREYHGASASEPLNDSQLSEPTSLSRNTSFRSTMNSQTSQHNVPQSRMDRLKFDAMDTRSKGIARAIGKTCSWFLEDPTFKQWTSPAALKDHHGFMWIKGKPGAGKSVLMKFLESHTQKKKKRKDICIAFYFNARGVKLEKSLSGMYRFIIYKLLAAVPDLQHILESSLLDSDDENEGYVDELMRIIQQATLELQDRELTIFVDALDECRDGEVQQMIDFFRDLCWDGHADGINIRVCFASRHYPIVKVPTGLQLTLEDASGHTTDLESYVDLHLELGTPEQILSVKTDVLKKSNGVFLWVILVIKILNDEFLNGRIHAVRKRLKEMPKDLADLFSDIIKRDNKNLDECLLCIRWILYAKRPLSLKEFYFAMMAGLEDENLVWSNQVTEQQMHTFLTTSSKGLAELTRGDQPTAQFIHESVRDYLVLKDGLKQLQHDKSIEEDHEMLKVCCVKGMEDNAIIASAMSTQRVKSGSINSETWKPTHPEATAIRQSVIDQMPFFEYAVTQVLHHADQAQPGVSQAKFLKDFEANNMKLWRRKCNLVQKLNVDVYKRGLDIVYACAERNLVHLIGALVEMGFKHNKFDPQQRFGSPLFAAFANKSTDAANLLLKLDNAEDVDAITHAMLVYNPLKRGTYDQVVKYPPWSWALRNGCDELALHLITTMADKSDLAAFDNNGFTALHHASSKDCLSTVQFLIDWMPDLIDKSSSSVGHSRTALMSAVVGGWADVVEALVSAGANVNLTEDQHATALHFAAIRRDINTLEILLDAGADINAETCYGRNALHYGMHGCLGKTSLYELNDSKAITWDSVRSVTCLLLDRGALYDAKRDNQIEWTPLHRAASAMYPNGEEKSIHQKLDVIILEILLSQKLDVDIRDGNGHTPIECVPLYHLSSMLDWSDHFGENHLRPAEVDNITRHVIKLFVKAGSSPNSKLINPKSYGSERCPLIFYAVVHQDIDLLRQLLKDGAVVYNKHQGTSILHYAAMLSDPSYTKILVQHKAQVSALDVQRRSALHVAVLFGHPAVVQVLLAAGASLTRRDVRYRSPSDVAMELVSSPMAARSSTVKDAAQQCLRYIRKAEQRTESRHVSL